MILPAEQYVSCAALGATEPPSIYMSVGGTSSVSQLMASQDSGATWASVDPGAYITELVAHPSNPLIAFALANSETAGPLRTLDGGKTWSQLPAPDADGTGVLRVAMSPPHELYAVGVHSRTLNRSNDEGETWQPLGELPSNTFSLEIDPHPGSTRYVLSQSGLLYQMAD